MKNSVVVCIVVAVAIVGLYLWSTDRGTESVSEVDSEINTPSGLRVEENAVVVSEQKPGTTVTGSLVHLAAPGFLVIHEDASGEPGAILGASALLPAGKSMNVKVTLSRASKDGETLHAMLHFEKGGNSTFSPAEDMAVPSRFGGSISGWFEVSSDAPDEIPLSI